MKAKIYKVLSILLALAVVFSACACILGTVSAGEADYEVSSDGTYKTIDEAIIAANGAGKGAGDTVTVKVKDGDTVTVSETSDFSTAHEFKLVITSDNGATITSAIEGRNIILGGPTEFSNVVVSSGSKSFRFNDNDVKFGAGTTLSVGGYVTVSSKTDALADDVDIEVNVKTGKEIMFSNDGYGNTKTFDKNINVVYDYDDPNTTQTFAFGSIFGTSTTTFNKNVNIYVKSGNVKLNNGYPHTFAEGSAVQIINASWNEVVNFDTVTTTNKWLLDVVANADALSYTDTAGKYAVNTDRYAVIAIKSGTTTEIPAANGELDLTSSGAGEYLVMVGKKLLTKEYFVSADGDDTDDGLTPDTAFKTIDAAIIAANAAGLDSASDTVTVNVIDGETVTVSETSDFSTAHKFRLIITSDNGAIVSSAATGRNIILGGPTEFYNVVVSSGNKSFRFHDNDVKFGAGTSLSVNGYVTVSSKTDALVDDVDIEINAKTGKEIMFSNDGYANTKTFNKNINVIYDYDNADSTQTFAFGSIFGTSSTTFNNNININVKSGSVKLNNGYPHTFGEGSAVQIINSSGNELVNFDTVTATNKWLLTNASEYSEAISFTDTVGQYAVDNVRYVVTATKKGDTSGTVYTPADGILDLTAGGAGEYELSVTKNEYLKEYYVSAAGNDVDGDGSEASPFKTVNAAVEAANEAIGYANPDDVVLVKVAGTDAVIWSTVNSGEVVGHDYTLKVVSAKEDEKATITGNSGMHIALGGVTEFSNIKIVVLQGRQLRINSFSVKLDEKVELTDGAEGVVIGRILDRSHTNVPQVVEINTPVNVGTAEGFIIGDSNDERVFYNSMTIIYDAADSTPKFSFGTSFYQADLPRKATYTKPINFNIENAKEVTFKNAAYGKEPDPVLDGFARYVFEDGSAIQIINSSEAAITADSGELAKIDDSLKWILTDASGKDGILSFTETAGIYNVADGYEVVAVKKGETTEYPSEDGVLDLTDGGAGEYDITTTHIAHEFEEVVADEFLASEATCKAKATYYKSCFCGEKSDETFEAGELAAHKPDREAATETDAVKCSVCGTEIAPKLPASDDKTDNKTEDKTEDKTENKTEDKTENKTEDKTENKTEDKVSPQTSDIINFTFIIALFFVSALGVVYTSKKLKKN